MTDEQNTAMYAALNHLIELGARAARESAKANSDDGHAGTEAHGQFIAIREEMRAQVERLQAAQAVATLHDDGYWTPAKSEAGRALNERLMRVGTRVEVCLPSSPAVAQAGGVDERAAFEAVIKKDGGDLSTFGSGNHVHYSNSAVNNAWTGWQARAALAAQPARVAMVPLPSDVVDKAQRCMNPSSFEYAGHLIAQFCRINGLTVGITPGDGRAG